VPDPDGDIVYRLLQTQAAKFSVTGEPGSLSCYLNLLVRDGDGKDTKVSVWMGKDELLHLAEHIFASPGSRL
jgi:hypothetical protein